MNRYCSYHYYMNNKMTLLKKMKLQNRISHLERRLTFYNSWNHRLDTQYHLHFPYPCEKHRTQYYNLNIYNHIQAYQISPFLYIITYKTASIVSTNLIFSKKISNSRPLPVVPVLFHFLLHA